MSKTFTFNRTVNSVDDAGIVVVREETVAFDPESGEFIIGLPKHVALMADYGNVHDKVLTEAVAKYEGACDTYSRERLGIKFEPMLLLVFVAAPAGVAKQYGLGELVSLGLRQVALDTRNATAYRRHDDGTIGPQIEVPPNLNRILLPDTPEIRAKYEELAASVRKAGEILSGIDGADYFLKISHGGSEPMPAEPVASASDDSVQRHSNMTTRLGLGERAVILLPGQEYDLSTDSMVVSPVAGASSEAPQPVVNDDEEL